MNTNPVALITGASSGIGLELAKLFANDKHNLVIVARSYDNLKAVSEELSKTFGVEVKHYVKDLAVSSTPDELLQALQCEFNNVDVLVNNAGFGWRGEFAKMDLVDALEMIQVNITSLVHLTRLILPTMIERKNGKILNVSSTASFQPGPLMAVYYATKAFVTSFSLALAEELRGTGVTVTALCPGPTPTNFGKRAGFANQKVYPDFISTDAKFVASEGYKGLMKGKKLVIPGRASWLGAQFIRFFPRTLPGKLIKKIQKKRGV